MKDFTKTTELIEYTCGSCSGHTWKLFIGQRADGMTFLNVVCANDQCVDARRQQLGAPEDTLIVWNEFDITGQGFDAEDTPSSQVN